MAGELPDPGSNQRERLGLTASITLAMVTLVVAALAVLVPMIALKKQDAVNERTVQSLEVQDRAAKEAAGRSLHRHADQVDYRIERGQAGTSSGSVAVVLTNLSLKPITTVHLIFPFYRDGDGAPDGYVKWSTSTKVPRCAEVVFDLSLAGDFGHVDPSLAGVWVGAQGSLMMIFHADMPWLVKEGGVPYGPMDVADFPGPEVIYSIDVGELRLRSTKNLSDCSDAG